MKSVGDRILVVPDEDKSVVNIGSGVELKIDTEFDKYRWAAQRARVVGVPDKDQVKHTYGHQLSGSQTVEKGEAYYPMELKVGDIVYVFHFAMKDNPLTVEHKGQKIHPVDYLDVFCRMDGDEIYPLSYYVAGEPIEYKMTHDLFEIPFSGRVDEKRCRVISVPVSAESDGFSLKKGEEVIFMKDADYDVKIGSKTVFFIKTDSLMGVLSGHV